MTAILGLYAGHDANAALVRDGILVAAEEEERVSRRKHHLGTPDGARLDVARYGSYDRIAVATPHQEWLKAGADLYVDHHLAHAYYAYATSGFERATAFALDAGGDRAWAAVYHIDRGEVRTVNETRMGEGMRFGYMYSQVTRELGFGDFDEGKVMGLAGHGDPARYNGLFAGAYEVRDGRLVSRPDFDWTNLFFQARNRQFPGQREHMAAAMQDFFEEIVIEWVFANADPDNEAVCLSGGAFANVQLNGKLLKRYKRLFVAPAMSDAGLAAGAALFAAKSWGKPQYGVKLGYDLGPIEVDPYDVAAQLASGEFVGLAYGRMEHGPRALGSRSILADPRRKEVVDELNKRLARVEFMPFAPVVLDEFAPDILEGYEGLEAHPSARHMTLTYPVREGWRRRIPAVVHVDGTARPQVVDVGDGTYYEILRAFYELTDCPALINTSFNLHGEPIVRTQIDALRTAKRAGLVPVVGGQA